MNIGIMGAGNIANAMSEAINGLDENFHAYAVASRTKEKAEEFGRKWNFEKAYDSYEKLAKDKEVDLIYVATPHSHHYENAKLCLENGRNVLLEKAFTVNASQAKHLITLAQGRKLFLAEAIWTRYMPVRKMVDNLLKDKVIGKLQSIEADFSIPISDKPRMHDPNLAGGALLDLGMYTLTFASMFFGNQIKSIESHCEKYETGVDATDDIRLIYEDGRIAKLKTSMVLPDSNYGIIRGSEGYIKVYGINNPVKVSVFDNKGDLVRECVPPQQINGYEYELLACREALEKGSIECEQMPHSEILFIMECMDELRKQWDMKYPFEN